MLEIKFDDIEALSKRIGEEFSPWGEKMEISQERIHRFAEVTGDLQWIHLDVERARRESPFGTTIAHGFLLLSLLPVLRVRTDLLLTGYGNIVNYGAEKLRFVSPVPAGSTVHARSRIVQVEKKAKGTMLTEEVQVAVVGSETPALSYMMMMLFQGKKGPVV